MIAALFLSAVGGSYHETFLDAWHALQAGDTASAVSSLEGCLELSPYNPNCAYYLACAEAKAGDREAALAWLERAAQWGYRDRAMLFWDEDLASLHDDAAFARIAARLPVDVEEQPHAELVWVPLWTALCSPDGQRLLSDAGPFAWDLRSGRLGVWPGACEEEQRPLTAFAPRDGRSELVLEKLDMKLVLDRKRLRAVGKHGVLWELAADGFDFRMRNLIVHPAGWTAIEDEGRAIRVVDLATGRVLQSLLEPKTRSWTLLSADGRVAVSKCDEGTVRVWSTENGEDLVRIDEDVYPIDGFAVGPHGRRLFTRGRDGVARLWNLADGGLVAELGAAAHARFAPDGSVLVTWHESEAHLWNAESGEHAAKLEGLGARVWDIVWCPDSRQLVGGGEEEKLFVWSRETGRALRTFLLVGEVSTVDVDGCVGAVGGRDGRVRVVDLQSGDVMRVTVNAVSRATWVDDVELAPDGKRLLVGCDLDAYVWDLETDRRLWYAWFTGATPARMRTHFSLDGETVLVSGRGYWTERAFDAEDGTELANLGELALGEAFYTPDGRWIVGALPWTRFLDPETFRPRWNRVEIAGGGSVRYGEHLYFVAEQADAARVFVQVDDRTVPLDCYSSILLDPKKVLATLDGVELAPGVLPPVPTLQWEPDARFVRAESGRARLRAFSDGARIEVRCNGELLPDKIHVLDLELRFDDVVDVEIRAVDAAGVLSLPHLVTFHRSEEPPVFGDS